MYPSKAARELAILLRISRELDIVGDVTATVDNPSELLAWATILTEPDILAWRAKDSGNRYLQRHRRPRPSPRPRTHHGDARLRAPPEVLARPRPHRTRTRPQPAPEIGALSAAWAQMPITPEDLGVADPPHPDAPASQDA